MREVKTFSRREIAQQIKPKLDWAVRTGDYEGFKEILTLAEIAPGSDLYRSLEAQFWRAVSEHQKERQKRESQ